MKTETDLLKVIKTHTKKNPIVSQELNSMFNFKGSMLRDAVRELRRQGEPICITVENGRGSKTKNGYYYCLKDAEQTINNLESRSFSMLKTAKAMREKCGLLNQPTLI